MRIWKVIKSFISLVLVLTIAFQLPLSTFATALETGSITLQPGSETIDTSLISKDTEEPEIVGEIESKRTEYSKEYLLSNGLHMAAVYADSIHYETAAGWQDIDNTLKVEGIGASRVYTNTAGIWSVQLPYQLTRNNAVTLTKDGYTLSFAPAGELRTSGELQTMSLNSQAETFSATALTASTAQVVPFEDTADDGLTLEKFQSRLQYANVFSDTNIIYDLQGNRLKESIVIDSYSSTLRGYRYILNTGGMIPVLAESGRIDLYDETGETVVMRMPAPYLIDNANELSFDVQVTLTQSGSQYILTYLLPRQWLASEDRSWPVILDPIVEADTKLRNLQDQTVCSKKQLDPDWGMVQCGYYSSEGITRFFVKYVELPALSSADVVVRAQISMYLLQNFNDSHQVEVHKVEGKWEEDEITWSNKPHTNDTIEDFRMVQYSGEYCWNVTDIVQDWYQGENTGMMFKMSDQVEAAQVNEWRQFLSSEYSTYRPSLLIEFRNNNGLEGYWDYTSASAGRAGTAYVNNYTGNLVLVRGDIGFGGNRMPVSISHIYNANDRADRDTSTNNADQYAGNAFGMGYGWRTNYNQLVYQWSTDNNYYVWEDGDGTDHYFYRVSSGKYADEDGLGLELTTTGSGNQKYKLYDKQGNASYFDTAGRLTKIENNQEIKSSIDITYTASDSKKISTITDGVGRDYNFTYNNSGLLTRISYTGTGTTEISYVSYEYDEDEDLKIITDKDGEQVEYVYDDDHRLNEAKNIEVDPETNTKTDQYKLVFQYTTTLAGQPSRIARVAEKDGTAEGGALSFVYSNNQTAITDHNNITNIYQFNNFGNTICIQDSEGRAQYAQYALNDATKEDNDPKKSNQLSLASKLQNTVGNLFKDSGFESSTLWTVTGSATQSIAGDTAYLGSKSLKVVGTSGDLTDGVKGASVTVAPGESYTYSAYVKSTEGATAKLTFIGAASTIVPSETLSGAADWTRLEISYTNTAETSVTVTPGLVATGTVYLDCVQLEKAAAASRYNLVENGDFRHGAYGWTYTAFSGTDGVVTDKATASAVELENSTLQITGGATTAKGAYQTLPISGSEGDTFVLAGWANGKAAPLTTDDRAFGLRVTLNYTQGDPGEFTASFNVDSENWQYVALPIAATGDYSSIKVEVLYANNVNTVNFDGIQLFKETFGQSYTYDDEGNIISVVDLQKQETAYEFDTNNNLTAVMQNGQAKMTYEYDQWHNVTKATTQEGLIYQFYYDDYGNNTLVTISDDNNIIVAHAEYSADGNRLVKTIDTSWKETTYSYDEDTNVLIWVQYPEDTEATRTTYTYDEMFRTATAACATDTGLNMSVVYDYEDDLLTSIQTPSTTYNFAYGDFSLTTSISVGSRTLATYLYQEEVAQGEEYDRNNDLDRLQYGNGDYIDYTYDALGRVIQETFEDDDTVIYRYDNDGGLAQVEDSDSGITTKYYYDFTGRMMKYTETGVDYYHSVGYEYDLKNNLTNLVENINGAERTTSYTYDDDNRVTSVTNGATSTHYYYDDLGRVERQETKQNGVTVLTEYFTYVFAGATETTVQIETYRTVASGYDVTYTYTYDDNGNITSVNDGTYTTSYVYDSQNQLIRENNQQKNRTYVWTYDAAGNRLTSKSCSYTLAENPNVYGQEFTYGDTEWGDLLTQTSYNNIQSDSIGNLTKMEDTELYDSYYSYTWEHGRELAVFGDYLITGREWECTYDANGMRIKRANSIEGEYTYVYDGSLLSSMAVNNNTLYFTYDATGTPLTVTFNGTTYYYVTNVQGDVVAILDAGGNTAVTYTYDAWGNHSSYGSANSNLAFYNPLRYRGYVYDQEMYLYYVASRYYDPSLGRWINADAFVSTGQGFIGNNMFAYCGNNPVNRADPTGQAWGHWILGAVIVAACAVATVVTCGGFAAAATAVCMVSSGVTVTLSTATVVAASAFIGSATAYGTAVLAAASNSNSLEEFGEQGNWGVVASTAFFGLVGGYNGYNMSKAQATTTTTNKVTYNLDGAKDSNYVNKRGWSDDMINNAINNGRQGTSVNMANGAACTVYTYPGSNNQYIVIENATRSIVQVSNYYDSAWIPDPRIVWDP